MLKDSPKHQIAPPSMPTRCVRKVPPKYSDGRTGVPSTGHFMAIVLKRKLLTIYWVQLIVNFLWSIIFVRFELLWLAAADIVLLLVLIGIMILGFGKVNRIAGDINIPYFLWVAFATYLNVATIFVN